MYIQAGTVIIYVLTNNATNMVCIYMGCQNQYFMTVNAEKIVTKNSLMVPVKVPMSVNDMAGIGIAPVPASGLQTIGPVHRRGLVTGVTPSNVNLLMLSALIYSVC